MQLSNLASCASVGAAVAAVFTLAAPAANAAVLRVPSQFATIQAAVDAATGGDEIRVGPGRHCGATITKPLSLRGFGRATVVGCEDGPSFTTGARLGFFLPGAAGTNPASGTQISGFTFDGRGVSNDNLEPIAFGIFARFAHDVFVANNRFVGTVQAVTNTGGDRWFIWHNRIAELTLFGCPGLCTGGDGIVLQTPSPALAAPGGPAAPANRPEQNVVLGNTIDGAVPDGFDRFGMVGVLVFSADRTLVSHNRIAIPDNPAAEAPAHGVVVTNTCCGEPPTAPGPNTTIITFNDASRTEVGFLVEGSGGQNTQGLVLLHNRGTVSIEPSLPVPALARGAAVDAPALMIPAFANQRYF